MTNTPDFDELFDEPIAGEERARLQAAHDLLVEVGPPAEVPPWLAQPPRPWEERKVPAFFDRPRTPAQILNRRRGRSRGFAMLAAAAAVAAVAFAAGYGANGSQKGFSPARRVAMHGTAAAPQATAILLLGHSDGAGNWPMTLRVEGLKQLPSGGYYELFLTRDGKPAATCGTFRVDPGATTVRLNAPYDFNRFGGWAVAEHLPGQERERVLMTT